ncbi:MAG TPA: hypothetical protein VG326_07605 [Tepidisphaeraceae bacterium]|jgi:hypothetical protein|nr:hypothetical protein [Tepidisphaeraceae bacterium]
MEVTYVNYFAGTGYRNASDQRGFPAREAADFAVKLIEAALRPKPVVDQATIDLLDKWDREQATDDPKEIARRQQEVEEFKEGMNRNRLEMEGPLSRNIYP